MFDIQRAIPATAVGKRPVAVGKIPVSSEVGTPTEINEANPPGRMLTALPLRMATFNS